MTTRNAIIVSEAPMGHFSEGIIVGTPKPGTCVSILAATEPDGTGRYSYEPWNGAASGEQSEVIMLLEDDLQGLGITDAYVTSSRCKLYWPLHGDELLVLVKNISGTSDAFAIGDKLMIDDSTGKAVITTGSPEMEPWVVLETTAAIAADTHVLCRYSGH